MPRRVAVGIVTSDKADKTRRVEIPRLVKHPKYGKYLRRSTVCYVHDEHNESRRGDKVEIIESRPLSRTKRWRLVRVLGRSRLAHLAALPQLEALDQAGQPSAPQPAPGSTGPQTP